MFGVGSLSYSRAVNAIAVTWLALWREARGDLPAHAGADRGPRPPRRPRAGMEPRRTAAEQRRAWSPSTARTASSSSRGASSRRGFEIVSTGGTADELEKAGVAVTGVSEASPASPRSSTAASRRLHPKLHAGILARRDVPEHTRALKEHGIPPVDVVVVNLYPFEEKVAKGAAFDEAIENIDVGGPSMLRAAAKNFRDVAVVVDPADYPLLLEQLDREGGLDAATRLYLAQKAFRHTARYEAAIAGYLAQIEARDGGYAVAPRRTRSFPYRLALSFEKVQDLRYGENPHQRAAFYSDLGSTLYSVAAARKLQGKELSFNNILDLDAAWRLATELDEPACVIVKHTNPCGVGARARRCGGLRARLGVRPDLGLRRHPRLQPPRGRGDRAQARRRVRRGGDRARLRGRGREALAAKKNLRVMDMDAHRHPPRHGLRPAPRDGRHAGAGVGPATGSSGSKCEVVTRRKPSEDEWKALLLAWTVAKHVKSNAIVFASAVQTLGRRRRPDEPRRRRALRGPEGAAAAEGTAAGLGRLLPVPRRRRPDRARPARRR